MPSKAKTFFLLFLILILTWFGYQRYRVRPQTFHDTLLVSGNIEVTDAEFSFKIPGRVVERRFTEGDRITRGVVVARLEDREYRDQVAVQRAELKKAQADLDELLAGSRPQEIQQAKAVVDQAQSWLDQLLAGSRPQEIAAARAAVDQARTDMENLKVEFERQKELLAEEVSSKEQYDDAETRFQIAVAKWKAAKENFKLVEEGPRRETIDQARSALKKARENHGLVLEGPRKETIDQARAKLEQAKAALALAETQLSYTTLTSPLAGFVLSKNIEPGEYVSPGTPVITVADLQDIWLRGYISETDLGKVKLGQKVRVTTDTYPGKVYEGRISFISQEAEFTPKNVQTLKERVKLVYRIKVTLANPGNELKPGMPADGEILIHAGG